MTSNRLLLKKVKPDYLYNSIEVSKLINVLMKDGKKRVSENLVYGAIDDEIKSLLLKKYSDFQTGFSEIFKLASLAFCVKKRRVGRTVFKFASPLSDSARISNGAKNISQVVRSKSGSASLNLKRELKNIIEGQGAEVFKIKERAQEEVDSNKALASTFLNQKK